ATGTHTPVEGYEIHHGHVERSGEDPLLVLSGGPDEGARRGAVAGTHWHGLLASDGYRRRLLTDLARRIRPTGRRAAPAAPAAGRSRAPTGTACWPRTTTVADSSPIAPGASAPPGSGWPLTPPSAGNAGPSSICWPTRSRNIVTSTRS